MLSVPSFRDPSGFCLTWDKRILRVVSSDVLDEIDLFISSEIAKKLCASQLLVQTQRLSPSEQEELLRDEDFQQLVRGRPVGAIFEHEKVEFASYPYEWPAEMLYAAGRLILDLAQSCLKEGYGLKDATPYNILFQGNTPLFVDLLSFERRNPCDPIWKPYAQFCRNFLLPLLAYKFWDVRPADVFTQRRDGLEPAEVYRFCSPLRRLLMPFLTQVSIPTWLSRKNVKKSSIAIISSPIRIGLTSYLIQCTTGSVALYNQSGPSSSVKLHGQTIWNPTVTRKAHSRPKRNFCATLSMSANLGKFWM